jgi:hypothetical protein
MSARTSSGLPRSRRAAHARKGPGIFLSPAPSRALVEIDRPKSPTFTLLSTSTKQFDGLRRDENADGRGGVQAADHVENRRDGFGARSGLALDDAVLQRAAGVIASRSRACCRLRCRKCGDRVRMLDTREPARSENALDPFRWFIMPRSNFSATRSRPT